MPNPYVNKVISNGVTKLDLTSDTVTADKLAQGYTAHDASGQSIVGTMTGGGGTGGVTQDAQGYLVLSDQGGDTPTPSGGLEYESGTWTPTEDVSSYVISFTNTHTVAPFFYMIADTEGEYSNEQYSNYGLIYTNWHQVFGQAWNVSTTSTRYGTVNANYRTTSETSITGTSATQEYPYTNSSDTGSTFPRYWATETGIKAYTTSASRYWRAGRIYKWIAVWTPTS